MARTKKELKDQESQLDCGTVDQSAAAGADGVSLESGDTPGTPSPSEL